MSSAETYQQFVEAACISAVARVDAENGRVNGVKLLGGKSVNGREYTDDAMRNAVSLYNGRKVYLNHPKRSEVGEDRPFQDWVGVIENARYRPDGIYGDLVLRKESPHYPAIIEAATTFASSFGCSHCANGESTFRNGVEVVYRITEVQSVDLVTEPATCDGLYESAVTNPVKSPYADPVHKPVDVLHDEFDVLMIDILREVTLATHDGRHEPLSELSARLHVLANELAWFNGRSPAADDTDQRIAAMRDLVYRLDNVLTNPTQPGAIELVERELNALADLLHGEPGRDDSHIQPERQPDGLDGSGMGGSDVADPNYESRFWSKANNEGTALTESRRR